ncbi:hypothetical protein [Dietzia sp.]|uniref:hypothetical protein n=1 Tax=Dietzia sp. TaxID=1871616 RepID=UPI002FDA272D
MAVPAALIAGSLVAAPAVTAQSFEFSGGSLGSLIPPSTSAAPTTSGTPTSTTPTPTTDPENQCTTEVVTPAEPGEWTTPDDETPAVFQDFADGAETGATAGPGGLFFPDYTDPEKKGTSLYKKVDMPLEDLVDEDGNIRPMGFDYFGDTRGPALQLRITGANYYNFATGEPKPNGEGGHFTNGFATIVLSPTDSTGEWNTLSPEDVSASSEFWVTKSIAATPGFNDGKPLMRMETATLKDIIAMNPDAQLDEIGVQKTQENKTPNTYIDNFVFDCVTYDFETKARETSTTTTDTTTDTTTTNTETTTPTTTTTTSTQVPSNGPDFGSLALGGGLAVAIAASLGGAYWAWQQGLIQLPPEITALLPK